MGKTMKYSFIFCYRNRFEHLLITIPRIRELYPDAEVIIAEQADDKKFRRANLLNEGARIATGDILVLHDIDHYPKDVLYYDEKIAPDVFLPIRRVVHVYNDLMEKPIDQVPGGYRHFRDAVDNNFFGGVISFKRDAFFRINGFSPSYVGWGFEDADLRGRVQLNHLKAVRAPKEFGLFYALDHPDSGPDMNDSDFKRNIDMSINPKLFSHLGINNCHPAKIEDADLKSKIQAFGIMIPKFEITRWIYCSEFDAPPPPTHNVTVSTDVLEEVNIQL